VEGEGGGWVSGFEELTASIGDVAVTGGGGVRGCGVSGRPRSWSVVPLRLCGSGRACDQGPYVVGLHRIELCCFSPFVGLACRGRQHPGCLRSVMGEKQCDEVV